MSIEMSTGSRGRTIAIWVVTGLLAALYLFSGGTKLAGQQMHVEHFAKWGYPDWFRLVVGAVEVGGAILLLVPSLAFYAALVLAVDILGAIYTHLTNNETPNAVVPLVLFVLLAFVATQRRPGTNGSKPGRSSSSGVGPSASRHGPALPACARRGDSS
jgi:uncharacterized membrane protein YphA (DoxX/SURF4 family)